MHLRLSTSAFLLLLMLLGCYTNDKASAEYKGQLYDIVNIDNFVTSPESLGENPSIAAIPPIEPKPPTKLTAHFLSPRTIELSWHDNSDNERWFKIEEFNFYSEEIKFYEIGATGANTTTYRLTKEEKLDPGARLLYRIRAQNDSGSSPYSNYAEVEISEKQLQKAKPLRVDTGSDQEIPYPQNTLLLKASVTHQGAKPRLTWSRQTGPGDVVFSDPHGATTEVTFSQAGLYELRLSAESGATTASDIVTVKVNPELDQFRFFFGYFPSLSEMIVILDAARSREEAQKIRVADLLSGLQLVLRVTDLETHSTVLEEHWDTVEWHEGMQRLPGRPELKLYLVTAEHAIALPPLDGIYRVSADLFKDGRLLRTIETDEYGQPLMFERMHFDWENNTAGLSTAVYPPFEPLQVTDHTVQLVLRTYHLDDFGLLDSAIARGKELLADDLSLKLVAENDTPRTWRNVTGSFTAAEPHLAVFQGSGETDEIRLQTRSTIEYDGAIKVELNLLPGAKIGEIERLYLEIPLRRDLVRLRHLVKGLVSRANSAREVTEDWSTTTFFPYIWLGEMDRGLAWFADSDDGFVSDANQAVEEFVLEDDKVVLRIHFINKPTTITEPRRIVFGLQASPTKPMPADFRRPVVKIPPHGGNGIYWAMHTWFSDRHPDLPPLDLQPDDPNRDPWHIIDRWADARETQTKIDQDYLDDWLNKHYRHMSEKDFKTYKSHLYNRFNRVPPLDSTLAFIGFYSQSYFTPEWLTFQDEWNRADFRQVRRADKWWSPRNFWKSPEARGPNFGGPGINATKSFRDYATWNVREWYRRGLGIYDDNGYSSAANTEMTGAYFRPFPKKDETQEIVPSHNLWALREYNKRNWILLKEIQPEVQFRLMKSHHMTNDMVLPIHTWNTIDLDLEWCGHGLFYPPSLRTHTSGRQVGVYPHAHQAIFRDPDLTGDGKPCNWVKNKNAPDYALRADWGMHVVHEILRDKYGRYESLESLLDEFGYGEEGTTVFNYWEDNYPISQVDSMVKSIAMERDGRWLIVLVSWSKEPLSFNLVLDSIIAQKALDAETGESMAIEGNKIPVQLGKYGVKVLSLQKSRSLEAEAGDDQRLVFPAMAELTGELKTYGEFPDTARITSRWEVVSGPSPTSEATFDDPNALETSVSFSEPGRYALRLGATDGAISVQDGLLINAVAP